MLAMGEKWKNVVKNKNKQAEYIKKGLNGQDDDNMILYLLSPSRMNLQNLSWVVEKIKMLGVYTFTI